MQINVVCVSLRTLLITLGQCKCLKYKSSVETRSQFTQVLSVQFIQNHKFELQDHLAIKPTRFIMATAKLKIGVACENLSSKSGPFCTLMAKSNSQWKEVGRTEVIRNSSSPAWATKLELNYNFERREKVKFVVQDQDMQLLGTLSVTLGTLVAAPGQVYRSIIEEGSSKKGYFIITTENVTPAAKKESIENKFTSFIRNGTALNFAVAIDFTASNGEHLEPESLHYRSKPNGKNSYTEAVRALGQILEDYDADNLFPAFGFGAVVPPSQEVSHNFFLNQHPTNPECIGVEGIIAAYTETLAKVELFGPTFFAPVINYMAEVAKINQDGRKYYVLLIITDGVIQDFKQTKSAIVNASHLPLSIIIVGVGEADFTEMEALDSDERLLQSNGRTASRDIVQFTELRRYAKENGNWKKAALAMDVLSEVPTQLVEWMENNGKKPFYS
ncbi:copine-9-like [Tigriopus californicus]|nr:copine-9-like [Tigriopus californicus]